MKNSLYLSQEEQMQAQKKLKIHIKHGQLVSDEELLSYPTKIRKLFQSIFTFEETDQDKMMLTELKFPIIKTKVPQCGYYSQKKTLFFRCFDCYQQALDQEQKKFILCKSCFQNGQHVNHRYEIIQCTGALCDCGLDNDLFKGNCKNHNGITPQIQQFKVGYDEKENFCLTFKNLFSWVFLLYKNDRQIQATNLGYQIVQYLNSLNETSAYYHFLTTGLLFEDKNDQTSIIKNIFRYMIKENNIVALELKKLFYWMRYLQQFKIKISQQVIIAYNTIEGFQYSEFNDLICQLVCLNSVSLHCIQKNIFLKPKKKNYCFSKYKSSLKLIFSYMASNQIEVKYLENLFADGIIQFPMLRKMQSKIFIVQDQDFAIFDEQDFQQYYWYVDLILKILKKCSQSKILLINMLKVYLREFKKNNSFSHNKNKIILPYENALGLIIFSVFQGDLSKVRIDDLKKYINQNQEFQELQLCKILEVVCQRTLICLKQYAKIFTEGHQIDENLKFFNMLKVEFINIQILTFKICVILLSQLKCSLQFICNTYENHDSKYFIKLQQFSNPEKYFFDVFRKKIPLDSLQNQFLKVLLQCSVSVKEQIYVRNLLQIASKQSKKEEQKFFKGVCQNIHKFNDYFFDKAESCFFGKNIKQNKNFHKYFKREMNSEIYHLMRNQFIDAENTEKIQNSFPYQKIRSMTIALNELGYSPHQKSNDQNKIKISNESEQFIGNKIFSQSFLKFVINKKFKNFQMDLKGESFKIQQIRQKVQQIKKHFQNFILTIQDINFLVFARKNQILNQFLQEIKKKSFTEKKFQFIKQLFKEEGNELKMKEEKEKNQKMLSKKKQKMERMKQKQNLFSTEHLQSQEDLVQCIVCRQQTQGFNNMCYLADLKKVNFVHAINKIKGNFFAFKSCFHCIHLKCFTKIIQNKPFINCPLCKQVSTIILPIQKELLSKKPISLYIAQKIYHQKNIFLAQDQFQSEVQQNILICLVNSIVQRCSFYLAQKYFQIKEKEKKLMIVLFLTAKRQFEAYDFQQKEEYFNTATHYLKSLNTLQAQAKNRPYPVYKLFAFLFQMIEIRIQNKKLNKKEIFAQVQDKLSLFQMQYCWNLLQQITKIEETSNQDQEQEHKLNILQKKSQKKQLNQILNFFKPPENVNKLIQLRDQAEKQCKIKQHIEAFCIICNQKFCISCQRSKAHAQEWHLGDCLFFNVFTGEIISYIRCQEQKTFSVYRNNYDVSWTPSKPPKDFKLDLQMYQQILKYYLDG